MTDYVIIGAGIAGLYAAYKLKKAGKTYCILESDDAPGGRAKMTTFAGIPVVCGAGIIRKSDLRLLGLISELNKNQKSPIDLQPFTVTKYIPPNVTPVDVPQIFKRLKSLATPSDAFAPFSEFARKHLGDELYRAFVVNCGYSDFEDSTVESVFEVYGVEYLHQGWEAYSVDWNRLVARLVEEVGEPFYGVTAVKIDGYGVTAVKIDDGVWDSTGKQWKYREGVVCAVRKDQLMKFIPAALKSVYAPVYTIPFLRLYCRFFTGDKMMKEAIPTMTIVEGPLQEIIPINRAKGIYMISYSDSKSAKKVSRLTVAELEKLVEKSLNLKGLKIAEKLACYWEAGIHGFSGKYDIKRIRRPSSKIYVLGEMASEKQGWTEGAIESVDFEL